MLAAELGNLLLDYLDLSRSEPDTGVALMMISNHFSLVSRHPFQSR